MLVVYRGVKRGLLCLGIAPRQVHGESATRAQASELTIGPHGRQRRQEPDDAAMALQQHFRHSGRSAEITVNLIRGILLHSADVEEIVACGMAQKLHELLVAAVAVFKAREAIDDPGAAPSCASAAVVEPAIEGRTTGLCQLWSIAQCDLIIRIECPQVGDMAVSRLNFFVVLLPLLKIAVAPDFKARQALSGGLHFFAKF